MTLKIVLIFAFIAQVFCAPTQSPDNIQLIEPQRLALLGCGNSQYACKTSSPLSRPKCIDLNKICNGELDCPGGEDEKNGFCIPQEVRDALKAAAEKGTQNDFAGTGFMFSVNNIVVSGGSKVKMFNQDSDNIQLPSNVKV